MYPDPPVSWGGVPSPGGGVAGGKEGRWCELDDRPGKEGAWRDSRDHCVTSPL